jgi:hypothetical protein
MNVIHTGTVFCNLISYASLPNKFLCRSVYENDIMKHAGSIYIKGDWERERESDRGDWSDWGMV